MKQKLKARNKRLFLISALILIAIIFLLIKTFSKENKLNLQDYTEVNLNIQPSIILLSDECRILPIFVSLEQSLSIIVAKENTTYARPLTHDLLKNIIADLNTEAVAVLIKDFKEGTYYADLVLKKNSDIIKIDSRPSDAIAIAARVKAKIYVKKQILNNYAQDGCQEEERIRAF